MSHLTEQDRRRIENQLDDGQSPLAIARQEKRAHSTIVRELRKHRKEDETEKKRRKIIVSGKRAVSKGPCAKFHREIVLAAAVNARSSNAGKLAMNMRRISVRNWIALS